MSYGTRFDRALTMAAGLHRAQVRKGGAIPYVTHLLAVASLVGESGGSEDEVIAALLHDAVEDQGGSKTEALIREVFGDTVADTVVGCSDTDVVPKPPWRERKEQYIAHLEGAETSASTIRVSCADKLHNARSILSDLRQVGEALWDRFSGGKEGTFWYYQTLSAAYFRLNAPTKLASELARVVAQIVELASEPAVIAE